MFVSSSRMSLAQWEGLYFNDSQHWLWKELIGGYQLKGFLGPQGGTEGANGGLCMEWARGWARG